MGTCFDLVSNQIRLQSVSWSLKESYSMDKNRGVNVPSAFGLGVVSPGLGVVSPGCGSDFSPFDSLCFESILLGFDPDSASDDVSFLTLPFLDLDTSPVSIAAVTAAFAASLVAFDGSDSLWFLFEESRLETDNQIRKIIRE